MKRTRVDCNKCKHYYITWDNKFPYGCKAMGFKSKQLPAITVYVSSDKDCLLYREKKDRKEVIQTKKY